VPGNCFFGQEERQNVGTGQQKNSAPAEVRLTKMCVNAHEGEQPTPRKMKVFHARVVGDHFTVPKPSLLRLVWTFTVIQLVFRLRPGEPMASGSMS
jgi:hypothetical protein